MNPDQQVLPKPFFLEQIFREKLRVERSGCTLSLILIHLANNRTIDDPVIKPLLHSLPLKIRTNDRTGILGKQVVAVLLPDTNTSGAEEVARTIGKQFGTLHSSLMIVTYPDSLFDQLCSAIHQSHSSADWLAAANERHPSPYLRCKRGLDVLGGITALIVLFPLMLVIAVLIRLTSEGDVFFRQTRLGKEGAPFTLLKFRSMYVNGNERIHQDYVTGFIRGAASSQTQETGLYKLTNDPRITPLGRWLRKTSLDELPQLINVIKGDMSLVGPRPAISYEARHYQAWHLRRILSMKPGITGLWQVEGRSQTRFDDMVRMDLRYIQNWTLWLDIRILWKTLPAVIRGSGAV